MPKLKICICAVHHDYQHCAPRPAYLQNVRDLIKLHSVDLVAEEATGVPTTYAQQELLKPEYTGKTTWKNVDLSGEERKLVPDINSLGIGTQMDFDLHMLREWVWVIRTSKAMKDSALLICGWTHAFSVAEKFQSAGFDVDVNVYFDKIDQPKLR